MMFTNLEDYYSFLNTEIKFSRYTNVSNELKLLINKLDSEIGQNECNIEIGFNDFNFKKGEYIPLTSYGDNCYPSLNIFDDLIYLKKRAVDCLNSKYKSKYYHLLYLKTNDKRDADMAIDCYFEFLTTTYLDLNDNLEIRGFLNVFDNLIYLIEKVKYRQREVIQFVQEIIQQDKIKAFSLLHVVDFVFNNMKLDSNTKEFFFQVVGNEINNVKFPELREEFLKLIISLSQKIGISQTKYQNLLGEHYLVEAEKEKGGFAVHSIYFEALRLFKKAGNKVKQDEVSKLIQDSKNSIQLQKIETKLESPLISKYFKSIDKCTTELITNYSSDTIYVYLIFEKIIFPKASMLDEFTKPKMFDFITTITFDKNKNISMNDSKGINSYQTYFQIFSKEHLKQIFYKGQTNKKITFESLKDYLENNTWYNNINEVIDPDGKDYSFRWNDFILPPLKLFFEQSEKDITNNSHTQEGYIMAIDSLTLRFEGVLRDFSNRIGAQTIEVDEVRTEQRIDFDKLFDNQKFKAFFSEDDIAFFKFLFTRRGINLRNNVAHSFYRPKDYSALMIWMLICAFLKLGNFELKKRTNNNE